MAKIKKFLYRVLCGFFLGLSIVAPGISGSVIAISMGIYRDLVRIASNPFKRLKQNILFCLPLGIGAGISAVLFVLVFQLLFQRYEKATYLLFVGLISGNLHVIFAQAKKCGLRWRYLIGAGAAFASALGFGLLAAGPGLEPGAALPSLPMLALGGLAAGASLLVPGLSASMILILFGVYGQLIAAAHALLGLDFTYALPFGLCVLCILAGLVLASKGIKLVFDHYPGFANSMVLGFMLGSLAGILASSLRLPDTNFNWLLGTLMLAAGAGISVLFVVLGKRMERAE